jgi:hypothetical protein
MSPWLDQRSVFASRLAANAAQRMEPRTANSRLCVMAPPQEPDKQRYYVAPRDPMGAMTQIG